MEAPPSPRCEDSFTSNNEPPYPEPVREHRFRVAAIHLGEVLRGRRQKYQVDADSLDWLALFNSAPFSSLYYSCTFILQLLALFEYPMHYSLKKCCEPPQWLSPMIQFPILVFFTFEIWVRYQFSGKTTFFRIRSSRTTWNIIQIIIVPILFVDAFQSIFTGIQYMRCLRPFFVLQRRRRTRIAVRSILRSFSPIFDVITLMAFVMSIWACGGLVLFHGSLEGTKYFASFYDAYHSLLVLLTTANNPDVMMPAYHANRWYSLFFVSYLVINLYILLSLLLATVYNGYKEQLKKDVLLVYRHHRNLLSECFSLVDTGGKGYITEADWVSLIGYYKPSWIPEERRILFQTVAINDIDRIYIEDWMELAVSSLKAQITQVKSDRWWLKRLLVSYLPERVLESNRWLRRRVNWLVNTFWFKAAIWFIILFGTVVTFWEAHDQYAFNDPCHTPLITPQHNCIWKTEIIFCALFTAELVLKIYGMGVKDYWNEFWNRLDGIVILSSDVLFVFREVLVWSDASDLAITHLYTITLMVRVIRIIRLVSPLKRYQIVILTLVRILPQCWSVGGILVCLYYSFSMIGMGLFANLLNPDDPNPNVWKPGGDPEWDPSNPANYYPNNFNDLLSSFITLFDLMIVNNWYEIMDPHIEATSRWAIIFFVSWYIIMVLVVLNVVTAFIIDAYDTEYTRAKQIVGDLGFSERKSMSEGGEAFTTITGGTRTYELRHSNKALTNNSILESMFGAEIRDIKGGLQSNMMTTPRSSPRELGVDTAPLLANEYATSSKIEKNYQSMANTNHIRTAQSVNRVSISTAVSTIIEDTEAQSPVSPVALYTTTYGT